MQHLRTILCLTLGFAGCSSDAAPADTDGTTTDASSSSSSSSGADSSSGNPACQMLIIALGDEPCVRYREHEIGDFVYQACGPVTCAPRSGPADGQLPTGLSVGPDCEFLGNIGEDRIGGWAQIVDVERDGETVAVPFCAVQESTPAGYTVTFTPGPVVAQTFDPSGPISLGDEDPTLRVRPATDCPTADCSSSFSREFVPGGFDPASFTIGGTVEDEGGSATLVQPITASADVVEAEFAGDPWVFSVEANYCMQPAGACNLINPQTDAMDAFSAFAVIMRPQPSR